jgi:hypothetical protein
MELGTPFFESTYPGPGFLRVEGVMARGPLPSLPVTAQHITRFGDHVELLRHQTAATSPAGSMLYVALEWRWLVDRPDEEIAASVRLYGPGSEMIAQADTPLAPSLSATVLGLAPPAATPPGDYALGLIVYRRSDLAPLAIHNRTYQQQTADDTPATGPAWPLGHVTLTLPASTPPTRMALGRFDYIELVEANVPQIAEAGSEANLELVWLPRPSAYRDNYTVKVAIQPIGEPGGTITVAEAPLGSPQYPSVHWTAGYAVRQLLSLSLSASLAPGTYSVHTALERSSDGLPIPARARWRIFTAPALEVGTIAIAR